MNSSFLSCPQRFARPRLTRSTLSAWLLAAATLLVSIGAHAQVAWQLNGWSNRAKLDVKNIAQGTQTDFPVLVVINTAKFGASFYTQAKAAGADLRFVDPDNTQLAYEINTWNPSGTSTVWVRVPSLNTTGGDSFYMYWNNPAATDAQNAAQVWSNGYVGVWHMESLPTLDEAPTNGRVGWWRFDEVLGTNVDGYGPTSTLNLGTQGNTNSTAAWVPGRQNRALSFDGVDDFVEISNNPFSGVTNAITVAAWIRPTANMTSYARIASSGPYWESWHFTSSPSGSNDLIVWMGNAVRAQTAPNVIQLNQWQHVAFTYNKDAGGTDEVKIYINGVVAATGDYSTAISATAGRMWIGSAGNPASNLFTGQMDEVRAYNRALTAAEIQQLALVREVRDSTSYGNHGSPNNLTSSHIVAGQIGNAVNWVDRSVSRFIHIGTTATDELAPNPEITLEVWAWRSATQQANDWHSAIARASNLNSGQDAYTISGHGWSPRTANHVTFWGEGGGQDNCANAFAETAWRYVVIARATATGYNAYSNGTQICSTANGWNNLVYGDPRLTIGAQYNGSYEPNEQWIGYLDEVRISNVKRSAQWVNAQYRSMIDDLLTVGAVETPPAPVTLSVDAGASPASTCSARTVTITRGGGSTTTTYLSDLTANSPAWGSAGSGYPYLNKDRGESGNPLKKGSVTYAKGILTHPGWTCASDICTQSWPVNGATSFKASIGMDESTHTPSASGRGNGVVFYVYLDGTLTYTSGTMTYMSALIDLNINTTGRTTLTLGVSPVSGDIGYDHATWFNARLESGGASTGTISLSTSTGRGDWSLVQGAGTFSNGTANDGAATYTYVAGDAGVVRLGLTHTAAQNVTITATEGAVTGTATVAFRDNVFVFSEDTTSRVAGSDVAVAGRPHDFQVSLVRRDPTNSTQCGVDTSYAGSKNLKGWVTRAGNDPGGAAPTIGAASLSNAMPGANNVTLTFSAGVASFNLSTTDVGKYALNLRDDSSLASLSVPIDGGSSTLTVRPFGLHAAVTGNPGVNTPSGTVFTTAGTNFSGSVRAVLWQAADDASPVASGTVSQGDGVPDTGANLADNPAAPSYSWTTALTAATPIEPSTGTLGSLANGTIASGFASGSSSFSNLSYSEVGSFTLRAAATDYLTTGVNLTDSGGFVVGRFTPHNFGVTLNTPSFAPACSAGGFTYLGQAFAYTTAPVMTVTARNASNATTRNYFGTWAKLTNSTLGGANQAARYSAASGTLDLSGLPVVSSDPTISSWTNGVATLTFSSGTGLSFTRSTPVVPFNADISLALNVVDGDGVAFATNPARFGTATAGNGIAFSGNGKSQRFGRLRVSNAMGAPQLQVPLMLMTEYWTSTGFVRNNNDSCTVLTNTNFTFAGYTAPLAACNTSGTPAGANAITFTQGAATGFRLTAPNQRGSVDLTLNLGASAAGNSCSGGASVAATAAGRPWLQGNWGGSASWNANPTARIGFGMYGTAQDIIYRREMY